MTMPEGSASLYYISSSLALIVLVALYFFGVWSRSYVMPSGNDLPLKRQMVGSIPAGLLTMGLYAKSAFPALTQAGSNMAFDGAVMMAYAIIFGMMSRETLERILDQTKPPIAPPGNAGGG